jgi:hypothetical protein
MGDCLKDYNGDTSNSTLKNANGPIGLYIAMEGVNWKLIGVRYICKFGECRKSFVVKWLFCKHVDKD